MYPICPLAIVEADHVTTLVAHLQASLVAIHLAFHKEEREDNLEEDHNQVEID